VAVAEALLGVAAELADIVAMCQAKIQALILLPKLPFILV
jgi:hypothetical protein